MLQLNLYVFASLRSFGGVMNRGSIQTGIWLIGLGILFLTGRFWPEILIVIGLSMLATALVPKTKRRRSGSPTGLGTPQVEYPIEEYAEEDEHLPPALGSEYTPPTNQFDTSKLPSDCPMCGGPVLVNRSELMWVGRSRALCPYCATPLPIQKVQLPEKQEEKEGEEPDEK